ncbi:MAG: Hsp20/alpha crystallin family protein [Candidatus Kryptoniota bacterium]
MTLIRFKPEREISAWTPFRDLVNMQREVGHLFGSLFADVDGTGNFVASWSPRTDVIENKEAYVIKAELPGVNRSDVKITLNENVLTIKGEKKQEKEENEKNFHRVERSYGSFERSFTLPIGVKSDKIDAAYKDGILTIILPKAEETTPKEIEVKAA